MSIKAKVKYLKSVLRFLAVITVSIASVLGYNMEEGSPTSFQQVLKYYSLLPQLIDPFPPKEKTLSLKSSHLFWNGRFLDATKKLRKIKKDDEAGLIEGTLKIYHRFAKNDLQIPAIMTLDWYRQRALEENEYEEYKKSFIKKIKNKNNNTNYAGKDLMLFNRKIGDTALELSVNGYITVNGNLVFENKDLVTTNRKDNKNWDLEIQQTQRFNITGNIGDRFFIDIKQDSEADFSWENDLKIEYRGQKNEILQKAEAGNINLNLVGMDAVNMGGNNSSLFGIKAVYQLGPVEMQSVIAREQVKKSEKTMTGGMESDNPISIKDYNFLVDRYFFIDDTFKNYFYPLSENYVHQYNANYVVGDYEVYQMITSSEGGTFYATAYVDPSTTETDSIPGNWKRLEEYVDYEIDRLLGYIRVTSSSAQNAIAIAYTTTSFNTTTQTFNVEAEENSTETHTNFKSEYIDCLDINEDDPSVCETVVKLKLIKDTTPSTPSSPTWPLMLKNVYYLGGSNIEPTALEVEIARDLGADLQKTHSDSGRSYLSIFNLDSEDQNHEKIEGGDGKIDLYSSIINYKYGELILPAHLPFAYDALLGNDHDDLNGILSGLNEAEKSPAMYYDNNVDNSIDEHEFVINVKISSKSSSMNLGGFMIVEGSETVRLGSRILQEGVDYTIDYFSGVINFISEDALDPAAEISVSYEENQFISFDQKLLMGTYMKYLFGESNYLAGGMFYYNQSIAEEKVDIGYEPMRNFAWNITGKYQGELGLLTRAVDLLPLIQTTKISNFSMEGNYAEIIPNPNPLGQAFIDDFESAKRTSSLSIVQRQWKMASPPNDATQDVTHTIYNRGRMIWYNPYEDEPTQNIWPEQSTSSQANNNTTKILEMKTEFQGNDRTLWNGIMIPFYSSEYNQSLSKYLDIWMNSVDAQDDSLILYIDIGHINEDWNDNGILDTEDEPVYGPGMGDGILSDGEDIGVDHCTNSYEDGWGGCLCNEYDESIYDSDLFGIYGHETEYGKEFCLNGLTYEAAKMINPDTVRSPLFDKNGVIDHNYTDPNGDDWCYNSAHCSNTSDYSSINGTEGNGQALGFRYSDTEDMDKNKTLDTRDAYFTFSIDPHQNKNDPTSMVVTETEKNGILTGWKLFRIPLISFNKVGDPQWDDVRSFRIRLESSKFDTDGIKDSTNLIKLAKIELVENEWKELGVAQKDSLDFVVDNRFFTVEVINTDESTEYKNTLDKLNIIREHDEYNDIDIREQSLVLSFLENPDDPDSSGLAVDYAGLIKNTFPALSSDKSLSYFAYKKMEMYVYGGDPESDDCGWCNTESSEVDLLFRIGKDDDDNYYEIRQPIYKGWDEKNHIDINIDNLTQLKIPIIDSPEIEILKDVGVDGCADEFETGDIENPCLEDVNPNYVDGSDPNGDNYLCGLDGYCPCDASYPISGPDEGEGGDGEECNGEGDIGEPAEIDYDGDGIYTPESNYDYDREFYYWDEEDDITSICSNCTRLHIKGSPAINNIQNIVMGVVNNSTDQIYGKILVNELRLTGVKRSREKSYSISGSLNFADLMSISGNYKHKDSGFHKLQQRLGTGNSDDTYSATMKLHPNIILPARWGVKTPITLNYSNSIYTPKYHPGSDILTENENINFNISDIQTRNEKISLSTSLNKSARSTNWFIKRTIDNISMSYSAIKTKKSSSQILEETKDDFQVSGKYTYNWGKDNYFSLFKFTKDWLVIGNILSQSRFYYTPDKFSTNIQFNESNKLATQRSNILNPTRTYSFNMRRQLTLNHKITKTLGSNYTRQIDSNLDEFRFDKWKVIKDMNPGRVESISEKFTNTYAPDFIKWLNPNITFNPTYNWNLNIIDTIQTADVKSSATFKTKIGLNIQDFIELVYTPENKGKSSRGRGRSRSSSSTNSSNKKINIQNPIARFILGKIHSLTSKLKTISSTYTYSTSHEYKNIPADLNPSYLYRFGLQESPLDGSGVLFDTTITNNNLVGSSGHSYSSDIRTSTNLNITQSINTSLEFKYANSLSKPSTASTTENKSFSYYPLGVRGDKGFPIANWSINWSKIEKLWILDNFFKSISLNHGFHGEQSMSYSNSELQNEQYSFSYSPVIGINTKTKGRNPIILNASYNLNQTIKNIDESTERNHNNQMSVTMKFKKSGGLNIDTFFFRDFYIRNNMDFSVTFNYSLDRKLMTSTRVSNISDFNEHSKSMAWSFKPNVSYSFTNWVTGNFYMIYGVSENKTSGRKEEKDFGFDMNIKIQG